MKSKPLTAQLLPAISKPMNKIPLEHPISQTLFESLKQRPSLSVLKQIHSRVVFFGLWSHSSLSTSLINCYLSAKDLSSSRKLFDGYRSFPPPTLVWNLLIRAYSRFESSDESIFLFRKMLALGVSPDKYTFTFVLTSCSNRRLSECGEMVHGLVLKNGFGSDLFVGNSAVRMYAVFGRTKSVQKLFDEMPERDAFSWTSLLSGYSKTGEMGKARDVFERMPARNEVSWAVMISGFVGRSRYFEALRLFHDMLLEQQVTPNEVILVSVLSACTHLGALNHGTWIHSYVTDSKKIKFTANICAALIDMYSKCGRIDQAREIFSGTSKRDVSIYTCMITGFSIHGLGRDCLRVFSEMLEHNVRPNDITILGLLNGFSHSGLVEEGSLVFSQMESSWGIVPNIKHFGSFIDLLARSGLFEKALEVIKNMPIRPDIVIWRSLLSACRIHKNVELGECVARQIKHFGENLLSNLNASLGKWDRVAEIRNLPHKKSTRSSPGCSWIEDSNGTVHEFRVDDQLHPRISEIREKLSEVLRLARLSGGYVSNESEVLFDLSEEDKEQAISFHSEKLALAYGLMSTGSGTSIRIVKNLRTCVDCHSAFKAISLVYKRELIVRDRSRFHTFKEGICSCNGYW